MGEKTNIEWTARPGTTGGTWNPWMGCHKVSPACAHCYAERDMTRYGRNFDVVTRTKDATFFAPLKWKEPHTLFTCSWSDFFVEEAIEQGWVDDAWKVIESTPQHTYQILTKRPPNIFTPQWVTKLKDCLPHVWLGVSVENPHFYWRIHQLQNSKKHEPTVRFLSIEPLLGDMPDLPLTGIQWAIVGTESGTNARPTNLDWIRRIRDRCQDKGVAFFVKQLTTVGGIKIPFENWPEDLRVREWPTI